MFLAGSIMTTLQKRIYTLVRQVLDSYEGAWMAWCDPRGDWVPLLQRVADDSRLGGFPLLAITETTDGEIGGPRARKQVQERIERDEPFVLLLAAPPSQRGWLWAHTLLAEQTYTTSLRDQLMEWGWQPHSLTITDDELALMARQGLQQDPATWGGGGLEPDLPLLLEILAGGAAPEADQNLILDLTIEQAGLPRLEAPHDAQNLARWRTRALARLLVTQAYEAAPKLISESNKLLIREGQRPFALKLLDTWLDSLRLSKGLPNAILEADKIAALTGQLPEAIVKHGPFLSHTAEYTIFANTCTRLAQKSGKELLQSIATIRDQLTRHAQSFWGDGRDHPRAIPWSELQRLSHAAQTLLDAAPASGWSTPDDAIAWYTNGGWRLDHAGEELLRTVPRATPELLALIAPLRDAYRARWEKTLIEWSNLWAKTGCPNPPFSTAGSWLAERLKEPRPTAILVVDALRYDLGATLTDQINQQESAGRASIRPARAPLPSITALGMGLALPMAESELRAEYGDKEWRLLDVSTGANLSVAGERRAWLQQHNHVPTDGLLAMSDVLAGAIPEPQQGRTRLLITDDMIDKLGHDDELELMGAGVALDRYRKAMVLLRDTGWRRILVVTDHGFIHWSGSADRSIAAPTAGVAYKSRRALAYPLDVTITGPHTLAPGGQWQIVPAPGAASWSAYGGLGYFHGGASLQEWVIPCIQVEWPLEARPVHATLQPLEQVLSVRPRVHVRIERGSMLVEDALPRRVEVVIRHAEQQTILFRSNEVELTPDQELVPITLHKTPGVVAAVSTPLRIAVRDTLTEAVIAEGNSTLRIELDEWS
jgi:hypothetical protein